MNLVDAIIHLVKTRNTRFRDDASFSHNRVNSVGEKLECFVKDMFAGTLSADSPEKRAEIFSEVFSYTGNQNNPPDIILKNGDAIEVKKIENADAALALNSSYPKAKIFSDSPMISAACRDCEGVGAWREKDVIYAVGVVRNNRLRALTMVYGNDYCAEKSVYERIRQRVKSGVEEICGIEFAETKELGRVNRVDPLGITYLRIRGMWGIENPFTVFRRVYARDDARNFNFMCVVGARKYMSFPNRGALESLAGTVPELNVSDVKIPDPNNPAQMRRAKLITFSF